MKADLHLHSNFSDGRLRPKQLVRLAAKKGINFLSLTDHDEVQGTEEFLYEARKRGIEAISGVELSSKIKSKEIHILGYNVDYKDGHFLGALEVFAKKRIVRMEKMLEKLHAMGLKINWSGISKLSKGGTCGRMHIALSMVNKGFVRNVGEAFTRFIGNGKPAHVPKEDFSVSKAVSLIKSAKGLPVLAHPYSSKLKEAEISLLIREGIAGIEVYHPKHSSNKEKTLLNLSNVKGIFITGGSDFHGWEPADYTNLGHKYIEGEDLVRLKNIINNIK